ncbi:hypothetical protein CBF56_07340 [Lactobacillus taiwanensis]|uniref:hypothetical protein n=2 Tax=Lactobacillus taiwanensis TaxID=508451 RepID=UPI000B998DF0|nr:hypothetical protein [Lactobacillus taiwanensis]OYS17300.1 hypothetical protein CBF56_07340 [Lactobacillus taiwanensis]OYS17451.1 hypothetical protein CBF49_07570 [Lactobacillus taiwanensis]
MNKIMPTDKITRNKNHKTVSLNQQVSQETQYLLSTLANRKSLQKGMVQSHSDKILTPEEWNKLKIL